jgi:hypothetical protein
MDDPYEALSSDIGRQGKYVMVSCWTDLSDEELLIWSLYAKDLRGVRIRFPAFPFDKHYRIGQSDLPPFIKSDVINSYVAAEHVFNDRYCIPPFDLEGLLVKVEYTGDSSLLYPAVLKPRE